MKPMRFFEIWKVEGTPPFCKTLVLGVSGAFELDDISTFIWVLLDGSHTIDSIIGRLSDCFPDVERNQIKQDVINVLERMDKDDLIILKYNPLCPYKELTSLQAKLTNELRETYGLTERSSHYVQ